MKLHEYQVKALLSSYGAKVVAGKVAYTPGEAYAIASELGGDRYFVKAQTQGGMKKSAVFKTSNKTETVPQTVSASNPAAVRTWADFMFGNTLEDDRGEDIEVRKVYIERSYRIEKTMYLCLMVDPRNQSLTFISSPDPAKKEFVYEKIPTATRPKLASFRKVFSALALEPQYNLQGKNMLKSIYKALISLDALKVEVSELVLTAEGELLVKEADVFFDDFALFRHPELKRIMDLGDITGEQELAYKWRVRHIPFKGNIGIMTNGVGLGLAVADTINLYGGEAAQIIDIGWNANRTKIGKAFQLVLRSANVDGLLIYVYGGSLHCNEVAEGIIAAAKDMSLEMPLVARLGGTNEEIAMKMIKDSGLPIIVAGDMAESAELVVKNVERSK